MNTLFSRASLKRSPRTRTRKSSISKPIIGCPPSRSSTTTKHKGKPLQIIPELSECDSADEFLLAPPSPSTDSPVAPSPRVTLSAYTFSIDDALLLVSDEPPSPPRSPALSASSSTSGSSSGVPTTPATSDDEDTFSFELPSPRLRPKRISIRPLCINKTRSIVDEVEDIFEAEVEPSVEEQKDEEVEEEEEVDDHDFYTRHFQDFISLYSPLPPSFPSPSSPSSNPRPDSLVLSSPISLSEPEPEKPKVESRGRSRHSKPLPLIPLPTPPMSTFPSVLNLPPVIRRKRTIPPVPTYPPPPPPSRPPPRMSIPADIEDLDLSFEDDDQTGEHIEIEQIFEQEVQEQAWFEDEEQSVYSQDTAFAPAPPSASAFSAAFPETPVDAMYDLPRPSIDSDVPRSSVDSCPQSSCSSSGFSFSSSSNDDHEFDAPHLRSRWSSSTLSSLATRDEPRSLLSPLRGVFGSRSRRAPAPSPLSHSRHAPSRSAASFFPSTPSPSRHITSASRTHIPHFPATPPPPSSPSRGVRRSHSRSSTSSGAGSAWGGSECSECSEGSNGGLRRKPIPVEMFLRC
ncbi:hypothetical protein BV22DRAFT_1199688 [Leucogyrophana mollusca]|uniref:Uncharacterized protein n=1 Tax=Leucogyrophana mollusca TaxID=85980 RepID=A0ACB8B1U8_9AGAM|nr:hypothetical protein BV22DRAFT_1199688 [Leucogyrophana mollusca]